MRFPEKRRVVMKRSIALGHCVCNPKLPCPCTVLIEQDLCPCAGERPDPPLETIRLTQHVRKAGCASKIGRADLKRVLAELPAFDDPNVIVGIAAGDDAGIYRIDGEWNLVQTVDVFSPVVDDPYTFGQISAANSVSDVYAMGGKPICALSIVGFPIEELPHEVMVEILRGGIDTMRAAGVAVVGGHSINDEEIKCGFAVTGLVGDRGGTTNDGARPGDQLVLTKPIGTGLISFAAQIGRATDEAVTDISRAMASLNKDAAELMLEYGAHACTDVTGFGLLGHLSEMATHSNVSTVVDVAAVPFFREAVGCVRAEIIPGAVERNRESFSDGITATGGEDVILLDLLHDAQTSGGLLVALPRERTDPYVDAMRARGHEATSRIGEVVERRANLVEVILNEPATLIGSSSGPKPATKPTKEDSESCCAEPPAELACCASHDGEPSADRQPAAPISEVNTMPEMTTQDGPKVPQAFKAFMQAANAPGAVDAKAKKLLAIALSISQRCEPCLEIHLRGALQQGISQEEVDEAAWMAIAFCGAPAKMFYDEVRKRAAVSQ